SNELISNLGVSPDGRFVYAANDDTISIFSVDSKTERIWERGEQGDRVAEPVGFTKDNVLILNGFLDGVQFVDVETGEELKRPFK
ncbi:MAG: lactonase family protein, partial [Planctomycetales bacterium]